jgi:hypothetical protein
LRDPPTTKVAAFGTPAGWVAAQAAALAGLGDPCGGTSINTSTVAIWQQLGREAKAP